MERPVSATAAGPSHLIQTSVPIELQHLIQVSRQTEELNIKPTSPTLGLIAHATTAFNMRQSRVLDPEDIEAV